ncbi:MAG: hypothetical protein QF590_00245 [Dehalococcoidia bacterium]|jgi:hypothetical protein|nr:hypothetical protein [Chloroflexota bacterium]MDP6055898.1 hypothetical protein [Dehalococcoidia bacterium]MDP7089714.1 hypothetical protein [Dehalococcoidia bacterium]MDP7261904.1 hypothetical protein [Dehalococcoidia bacterium]MDP7485844.1 hypothetical protein [Dehalococcoidia bacterium]|tara:strand:+ start:2723 stop:2965 length:243 start_codon:yes stop_codon:yes gene_type:complete
MSKGETRPTVEELISRAESMNLDAAGVREAFEHSSVPDFADQTSSWLPDSDLVYEMLFDSLELFLIDEGRVLNLGLERTD